MGLTTDPQDPDIHKTRSDGQQEVYLVLSEDERAKGFMRPVRKSYRHVGIRPGGKTRELTAEEHARYDQFGYVLFEEYEGGSAVTGRFWTQEQLNSSCGTVTTMGDALAETYARNPKFYNSTFCCGCGKHFPLAEFVWDKDNSPVGS